MSMDRAAFTLKKLVETGAYRQYELPFGAMLMLQKGGRRPHRLVEHNGKMVQKWCSKGAIKLGSWLFGKQDFLDFFKGLDVCPFEFTKADLRYANQEWEMKR